jgi:hypothetical protein
MGETQFTPGPWVVSERNPRYVMAAFGPKNDESLGPDYYADVAEVTPGQPSTSYPPSQSLANAHLMAAAPRLYGALELVDAELADPRWIAAAIPRLRAMIAVELAAARGEEVDRE